MNSISTASKNALVTTVRALNQPLIKEGIKNVAGCVTFAFGVIEVYDLCQVLRGREITTENGSKWVTVSAKISLVLSAGVSRPGMFMIGCVAPSRRFERVFGPNTRFAVNPWHPHHVVSIAAVLLALPAIAQSTYKGSCWVHNKIQGCRLSDNLPAAFWLTDAKVRLMNLFNIVTSRPVLHMGNQLGRFVLRSV